MYFLGKFFTLLLTDQLPYLGPWGRIDWHRQVGSIGSAVLTFFLIHTDRQTSKKQKFSISLVYIHYTTIFETKEKKI